MNKNTIFAFILILATVGFFSSTKYNKFYYEKIYPGKPYTEKDIQKYENKKDVVDIKKKESENKSKEQIQVFAQNDSTISGDTIWVETDKMIVGISEIGARIVSVKIKDFKYTEEFKGRKKGDLIDILPVESFGGAQLKIGSSSYDKEKFELSGLSERNIKVKDKENKKVDLILYKTNGDTLIKEFSFENNSYKIGMNIMEKSLPGETITIGWSGGIEESEKTDQTDQRVAHYYNDNGDVVQHESMKKDGKVETSGFYKWIGETSKYFFVCLVADTAKDADITISAFEEKDQFLENSGKANKNRTVNYDLSYRTIAEKQNEKFWFYAGPTKVNILEKYHLKFEKVIFPVLGGWQKYLLGADTWFPWICDFTLWLLIALFKTFKDYGIAIILLTILSKVITYPMTVSSMKSMNRMKDVQPKVNDIRNKHKNNPKKMNEEMMALYKKEGINPLNPGCLPLFLQMPVFIALFIVLRKAIELRGANTVLIPWISDLSKPETLISLKSIIPGGIPMYGSSIALLPILMALLTFFQNKMTIKDPNQKAMIYFMPIFMLVLFNNFPAGLVLYWTFSNALGIVQQYFINKSSSKVKIGVEDKKKILITKK